MAVKVVHEQPAHVEIELDYVHVQTQPDPLDDTVTLVTITRVMEKLDAEPSAEPTAKVRTLVSNQPMPAGEAVGLARCYAERKNIPVVYAET